MNKLLVSGLALAVIMAAGCKKEEEKAQDAAAAGQNSALQSEEQKVSYSMGVMLGERLKSQGMPLNVDSFNLGVQHAFAGDKREMSVDEMQKVVQEFQQKQLAKMEAEQAELGKKNREESDKFLAENAKKEGVKVTPSGLQYKVVTEGKGKKPTASDNVKVHYKGTLPNGTEFDSSYSRNEPATFPLGSVIPGWTEGLQLMSEGSKYQFVIPSDLAYGPGGAGGVIGPNQALVFEVELLSIEPATPAEGAAEPAKQ